jgi:hypothetical protein
MRPFKGLGHADTLCQQRKKHGDEKDADDPLEDNHVGCSNFPWVNLRANGQVSAKKRAQSVRKAAGYGPLG